MEDFRCLVDFPVFCGGRGGGGGLGCFRVNIVGLSRRQSERLQRKEPEETSKTGQA